MPLIGLSWVDDDLSLGIIVSDSAGDGEEEEEEEKEEIPRQESDGNITLQTLMSSLPLVWGF